MKLRRIAIVTTATLSLGAGACGEMAQQGPTTVDAPTKALNARVIRAMQLRDGTVITIDRGTSGGAAVGMSGEIVGVPTGTFTLAKCNERTCTAKVATAMQELDGGAPVVLKP